MFIRAEGLHRIRPSCILLHRYASLSWTHTRDSRNNTHLHPLEVVSDLCQLRGACTGNMYFADPLYQESPGIRSDRKGYCFKEGNTCLSKDNLSYILMSQAAGMVIKT
ncbi:hypothetical protein ABIC22_001687 [Paenibacillus sp. PvP094]|uniref:hypothetical protein n=1 Tax=Paenibacillus illinoisensis TaxID=59845 RepID=UPI00301729D9